MLSIALRLKIKRSTLPAAGIGGWSDSDTAQARIDPRT